VEQAYPARLEQKLRAAGYPHRVINAGVSGDTTAGGLRRVDAVLALQPAIVILELGANDGLRGIGLDEIRANLEAIITRLRAADVEVVLAGMKLPPNYGPTYTDRFAAMYARLARERGVALMPFFLDGVAARPELNQPDGIHPTAEGYQIIVEKLWPIVRPLLGTAAKRRSSREQRNVDPTVAAAPRFGGIGGDGAR
jgi:acyl-CoA thioesterase-1